MTSALQTWERNACFSWNSAPEVLWGCRTAAKCHGKGSHGPRPEGLPSPSGVGLESQSWRPKMSLSLKTTSGQKGQRVFPLLMGISANSLPTESAPLSDVCRAHLHCGRRLGWAGPGRGAGRGESSSLEPAGAGCSCSLVLCCVGMWGLVSNLWHLSARGEGLEG